MAAPTYCASCNARAPVSVEGVCNACEFRSWNDAAKREYWKAHRVRIILTFLPCLIAVCVFEFATVVRDSWREVRPRSSSEWWFMWACLLVFPLAVALTWYGWFGWSNP